MGCGGLKFWSAPRELNGIFTTHRKFMTYGNLWQAFETAEYDPEWWCVFLGSNDCDDFWGHELWILAELGSVYHYKHIDKIIKDWLKQLSVHIVSFFKLLQCKKPEARIMYVTILPRIWWTDTAKELAWRIDHFVEVVLRKEHNIHVKCISAKRLLKFHTKAEIVENGGNEVLPGFLEGDNTHLNFRGLPGCYK